MNQTITIASLFVGVLIIWFYIKNTGKIAHLKIEPKEAKKRLDTEKGIILLDVRTQEEFLEKHIPKSTLIPLNVLAQEASLKLPDKQATIFAYCRSGSRSRAAVRILLKQGYVNVFNLGGIIHWPFKTVSGKK
ncbi:rhodanese-like domain-containing protein [Desulfosporosinus nitroreducens]|uniref:Rhodanese-like domain-containing protein n=1 Tax=Desulfosporosinus nitroreducens TaxID=2018668 RepID=A0ABT8QYT4_9FIRM|nr:rhodanese-like domain-containing protein [Desulfosporosinus nitroreducens]MCO1601647.1 rhodanese-like domain-containing protein [Desulfosporosinus nitroreducens]MDO0825228.1 rhodanese-like domain-containing protein [Desulfosporosinus nitroreducens]